MRRSAWIGAIVVAIFVIAGVNYFSSNIHDTIAGQLARPSLIDRAPGIAGNSIWFWFDNGPAELKLSARSTQELLRSRRLFNDCSEPGRVCSSPVWAGKLGFDIDGIETPNSTLCATSSDIPESAEVNEHIICLDPKTHLLYYLDFTLGER